MLSEESRELGITSSFYDNNTAPAGAVACFAVGLRVSA